MSQLVGGIIAVPDYSGARPPISALNDTGNPPIIRRSSMARGPLQNKNPRQA
jgi:hypothetical protein